MRSITLAVVIIFLLSACGPAETLLPAVPTLSTSPPAAPTSARLIPTATPIGETTTSAPLPTIPAPSRLSTAELDHLFKTWMTNNLFPLSPGPNLSLTEITPEEVWDLLEAQVFVVSDPIFVYRPTFLVRYGAILELGAGFDGLGMKPQDLLVTDLNEDGKPELVYTTTRDAEVMQNSRIVMLSWHELEIRTLEADFLYPGRLELRAAEEGRVQVLGKPSTKQKPESLGELVLISERRLTVAAEPEDDIEWFEHNSERFGISFQVPGRYTQVSEDHFQGEDGFILIEPYHGPARAEMGSWQPAPHGEMNFSIVRACNLEVNAEPGRYGLDPQVRLVAFDTPSERCLIAPSSGAVVDDSLILFHTPDSNLALLRTTSTNLDPLNLSLLFDRSGAALFRQEVRPYDPSQEPVLELETRQLGELTLEEYRLYPDYLHTPMDMFAMQQALAEPLALSADRRTTYYELNFTAQLDAANAILAPAGFYLEPQEGTDDGRLSLFEGETFILQDFRLFGPPTAGTGPDGEPNFAMLIEMLAQPQGYFLVRKNDILPYDLEKSFWTQPVFVEGGMAALGAGKRASSQVQVKLEGETDYTFISSYSKPQNVLLQSWNGRWVLLVDGLLVIDGEIANPVLGVSEIFNPGLLRGKPFFFFIKEGLTGLSYSGQELDLSYEEVMHNMCCWGGGFNPRMNEDLVWFYARKGGWWYYVELGRD
jgi:hypothetical protein